MVLRVVLSATGQLPGTSCEVLAGPLLLGVNRLRLLRCLCGLAVLTAAGEAPAGRECSRRAPGNNSGAGAPGARDRIAQRRCSSGLQRRWLGL